MCAVNTKEIAMSEEETIQDQDVAENDAIEDDTDDVVIDEGEEEPTENADESDQDSENADESDQDSEEDKTDKTQDAKITYAFKKKSAQLREEKEKREALEQELAKKNAKLEELTAPQRPVVPDLPDSYDPQYAEKVAARDEAIKASVKYDQDIANAEARVREGQEAADAARHEQLVTQVNTFKERAESLDLDLTEFKVAEKAVATALGNSGGAIAEFLLQHEKGPLLVSHLNDNDLDLDKVTSLNPVDAAVYLVTEVVPKLADLKSSKKISKAPRAAKTLSGRGKTRSRNPLLKGATFE